MRHGPGTYSRRLKLCLDGGFAKVFEHDVTHVRSTGVEPSSIFRCPSLSISLFVSPSSVRLSRRRARYLLFARLSSSAACLRTAGTLAPEPVPPLSFLHPATLPALQRVLKFEGSAKSIWTRTWHPLSPTGEGLRSNEI